MRAYAKIGSDSLNHMDFDINVDAVIDKNVSPFAMARRVSNQLRVLPPERSMNMAVVTRDTTDGGEV